MKFKIKTEPVCVVLVAAAAYTAITIIMISMGVETKDVRYPVSLIAIILEVSIGYIVK